MGLENCIRSSPARVGPTAVRGLPKLVSSKSLSECCEGPNEKKYVGSFLECVECTNIYLSNRDLFGSSTVTYLYDLIELKR